MTRTPFATVVATTLTLVAGSAWVGGIGAVSLAADQTSPPNAAAYSGQGQQSPECSKKVEDSAAGTVNDPPAITQPGGPSDQPVADLAPSESDAEAFAATLRLYELRHFRQAISDPQLLPQLENMDSLALAGTQITDNDLRHLERLNKLEKLAITDTRVEGRGLTHLKGLSWLTSLRLIGPQATDEWLRSMPELPNLKTLELRGSRVTDAGLQHLKKFPNLKFLSLANTEIGDEGLKVLQYLPKVFTLDLADTKVSDRGLAYLKHTPWLVTLSLGSPNIQGFGTKHLLDLPNLDQVQFIGHGVTDQWMHPIEPLRSMYWLDLHRTNVTAAGIAAISEWTELKHLYLNRNPLLTDDVVEHLKGLRELDVLELHRTGITPSGVSTLRQALPDTSVRYQLEE